jgi:hypothetical protein
VLGESGAFKALTLDLAEELGLPLADLHDEDSPALRAALPPSCRCRTRWTSRRRACRSPIIYTHTLGALMDDARVGGGGRDHPVRSGHREDQGARDHAALDGRDLTKPLVFAGLTKARRPRTISPTCALAAFRGSPPPSGLSRLGRPAARQRGGPCRPYAAPAAPGLADEAGVVPEYRAKALLAPWGSASRAGLQPMRRPPPPRRSAIPWR